jgi:hypothetical protein
MQGKFCSREDGLLATYQEGRLNRSFDLPKLKPHSRVAHALTLLVQVADIGEEEKDC